MKNLTPPALVRVGLETKSYLSIAMLLVRSQLVNYWGAGMGRGGGGKFLGRSAVIWGGLKFSGSAFRVGLQFLGAFGRCARINGFCVTEY